MNEVYIVVCFPAGGYAWSSAYTDQPAAVQRYHEAIQLRTTGQVVILVGVSLVGVKELLRYEPRS